jgi:hypothetical protein
MDAVAGLLDGPRARGAFVLRSLLDPPWSMRIADEAPLCLIAITQGNAWLVPEDGEALPLGPGDVAVIRGPDPYTLADDPGTEPQVIILPGQRCVTPDGQEVTLMSWMGVRTWGNSPIGSTVMLNGTYELEGDVSRRLLGALPPLLVLPASAWESPLVGLLAEEIVKDEPGQEAVLDRLLDLLLIAVLRAWFARPDAETPGWYRAYSDPVVGKALRLIHNDPAHPWTVAELAAEADGGPPAGDQGAAFTLQQAPAGHATVGASLTASLRDDPERPETVAGLARRALRFVPGLAGIAVSSAWSGVRPVTPDGLPLIGPMPGIEGLWVAAGHGPEGVMLAPSTARMLSAHLTGGGAQPDAAPFDPARLEGATGPAGHGEVRDAGRPGRA